MRVELLADYRGVLTNELFYPAGVYEMDGDMATGLIQAGRAVALDALDALEPEPKPKTVATKRGRK